MNDIGYCVAPENCVTHKFAMQYVFMDLFFLLSVLCALFSSVRFVSFLFHVPPFP